MDISDFVRTVLVSVNSGVDAARQEMSRDVHFANNENNRTVEFDIAVSAEQKSDASGKAGVRVLQFAEGGGSITKQKTNSTVSRIKFGVNVTHMTKEEAARDQAAIEAYNDDSSNFFG